MRMNEQVNSLCKRLRHFPLTTYRKVGGNVNALNDGILSKNETYFIQRRSHMSSELFAAKILFLITGWRHSFFAKKHHFGDLIQPLECFLSASKCCFFLLAISQWKYLSQCVRCRIMLTANMHLISG